MITIRDLAGPLHCKRPVSHTEMPETVLIVKVQAGLRNTTTETIELIADPDMTALDIAVELNIRSELLQAARADGTFIDLRAPLGTTSKLILIPVLGGG